jgi:hypothetical protein
LDKKKSVELARTRAESEELLEVEDGELSSAEHEEGTGAGGLRFVQVAGPSRLVDQRRSSSKHQGVHGGLVPFRRPLFGLDNRFLDRRPLFGLDNKFLDRLDRLNLFFFFLETERCALGFDAGSEFGSSSGVSFGDFSRSFSP